MSFTFHDEMSVYGAELRAMTRQQSPITNKYWVQTGTRDQVQTETGYKSLAVENFHCRKPGFTDADS